MRGPLPNDLPLLAKSWVQEMRHAPFSRGVPDEVYFSQQRRLVLDLLRASWTIVCCNEAEEDHIYGFITFQLAPGRLHWLYVKSTYQRAGLGTKMLQAAFGETLGLGPIACSQVSKFAIARPDYLARYKLLPCPYLLMAAPPPAPSYGAQGEQMTEFEPSAGED